MGFLLFDTNGLTSNHSETKVSHRWEICCEYNLPEALLPHLLTL